MISPRCKRGAARAALLALTTFGGAALAAAQSPAAPTTAHEAAADLATLALRLVGALGLLLCVLGGALVGARRLARRRDARHSLTQRIVVREVRRLDAGRAVYLVELYGRWFLIGAGEHALATLGSGPVSPSEPADSCAPAPFRRGLAARQED